MLNADPPRTLLCRGILSAGSIPSWCWSFSKYSTRCGDAWILAAIVRMDAMTSKFPWSTELLGNVGSNSQMALLASAAASVVIWLMMAALLRFRTWPRHLIYESVRSDSMSKPWTYGSCCFAASHSSNSRRLWEAWITLQIEALTDALSSVTANSWIGWIGWDIVINQNTDIDWLIYLWLLRSHDSNPVKHANKVATQILPIMCPQHRLETSNFRAHRPHTVLDFNPVSCQSKVGSMIVIACPCISSGRDFSRSWLRFLVKIFSWSPKYEAYNNRSFHFLHERAKLVVNIIPNLVGAW